MLTVLTQKPTFLLGNWDKSYWRGSLLTELSAPIEVVARLSELNRIVLWKNGSPVGIYLRRYNQSEFRAAGQRKSAHEAEDDLSWSSDRSPDGGLLHCRVI